MKTKQCSRCRKVRPVTQFPRKTSDLSGYASQCRWCKHKSYIKRNAIQKISTTWRELGITWEWYEAKLEEQDGCCAICHRRPKNTFSIRLHVDHDHGTNKPRGLLCGNCNMQLGWLERRLDSVVEYLDQYDG